MFRAQTYYQRRQELISSLDKGLILLLGNEESPKNYTDNTYRFRQDSNFLYFAGHDKTHLAAIIDIEAGTTTLYGNDPDIEHVIWMGNLPSLREMADQIKAEATAPYEQLAGDLKAANQKEGPFTFYRPTELVTKSRCIVG